MSNEKLDSTTTGFGIAAAVAIIGNTLLAWVKDSYPSLQAAMKAATSHHWITHGLAVVGVFFLVGFVLTGTRMKFRGVTLAIIIAGATVLGGLGLVGWFFFA